MSNYFDTFDTDLSHRGRYDPFRYGRGSVSEFDQNYEIKKKEDDLNYRYKDITQKMGVVASQLTAQGLLSGAQNQPRIDALKKQLAQYEQQQEDIKRELKDLKKMKEAAAKESMRNLLKIVIHTKVPNQEEVRYKASMTLAGEASSLTNDNDKNKESIADAFPILYDDHEIKKDCLKEFDDYFKSSGTGNNNNIFRQTILFSTELYKRELLNKSQCVSFLNNENQTLKEILVKKDPSSSSSSSSGNAITSNPTANNAANAGSTFRSLYNALTMSDNQIKKKTKDEILSNNIKNIVSLLFPKKGKIVIGGKEYSILENTWKYQMKFHPVYGEYYRLRKQLLQIYAILVQSFIADHVAVIPEQKEIKSKFLLSYDRQKTYNENKELLTKSKLFTLDLETDIILGNGSVGGLFTVPVATPTSSTTTTPPTKQISEEQKESIHNLIKKFRDRMRRILENVFQKNNSHIVEFFHKNANDEISVERITPPTKTGDILFEHENAIKINQKTYYPKYEIHLSLSLTDYVNRDKTDLIKYQCDNRLNSIKDTWEKIIHPEEAVSSDKKNSRWEQLKSIFQMGTNDDDETRDEEEINPFKLVYIPAAAAATDRKSSSTTTKPKSLPVAVPVAVPVMNYEPSKLLGGAFGKSAHKTLKNRIMFETKKVELLRKLMSTSHGTISDIRRGRPAFYTVKRPK